MLIALFLIRTKLSFVNPRHTIYIDFRRARDWSQNSACFTPTALQEVSPAGRKEVLCLLTHIICCCTLRGEQDVWTVTQNGISLEITIDH